MKKSGRITNRDRILTASIELFNRSGATNVTTNHIASALKISPGNLYFHFQNKEEIVRELFVQMRQDFYEVWRNQEKGGHYPPPMELIEKSFEVFFKFRFFHREMYALRRRDPQLAKLWRTHIKRATGILLHCYSDWIEQGIMRRIDDMDEMRMITETVFMTSSSFLHFFEGPDRPATRRSIEAGVKHLLLFLLPYHTEDWREKIRGGFKRSTVRGEAKAETPQLHTLI